MTSRQDYRAELLAARRRALAGAHPTTQVLARLAAARAEDAVRPSAVAVAV
jgi:hypothetical protein